MTFEDLEQWRTDQKLTIAAACRKLGISWNKWRSMRVSGKVPISIALACKAIYHRLDE